MSLLISSILTDILLLFINHGPVHHIATFYDGTAGIGYWLRLRLILRALLLRALEELNVSRVDIMTRLYVYHKNGLRTFTLKKTFLLL